MRRMLLFLAAPLLLATPLAGRAATVVQTITGLSQSMGDFTPFDINALPFDTTLGTLLGVSVELSGNYTPQVFNDNAGTSPPTTVSLSSHLFVFATNGGPTTTIALGSQTVPLILGGSNPFTGSAIGTSTPVDQTINLADLAAFENILPGPPLPLLVEYGFRSTDGIAGSGSDLTSFSGQAVLTYTYAVPEPPALLLLAAGLAGLAWIRRRTA
ncbi:MAG: PEP-CTERM sorting domain-containing protein [Rhodospirillales bacterium]|nr:PEP-CTERM sorting domain-containing protein [Rhodospirillales bacterium]MDE2198844.1 PEP-CTERM sorting domain-containing protein [Rhodospirillales bacterium]MDE2575700.1 PEP-CTERM sorting domain-containing protein [Rhodospirillales bacterium]